MKTLWMTACNTLSFLTPFRSSLWSKYHHKLSFLHGVWATAIHKSRPSAQEIYPPQTAHGSFPITPIRVLHTILDHLLVGNAKESGRKYLLHIINWQDRKEGAREKASSIARHVNVYHTTGLSLWHFFLTSQLCEVLPLPFGRNWIWEVREHA